jgi:hypothetical protein
LFHFGRQNSALLIKMTLSTAKLSKLHTGLVLLFVLLLPVCNLGAIRWGFRPDFHTEAELVLFLFYAAPLWGGFAVVVCFEVYRRAVLGRSPERNLIQMLTVGGFVTSGLSLLLCPVGPSLWSIAGGGLILTSSLLCAVLAMVIHYLLRLRQQRSH